MEKLIIKHENVLDENSNIKIMTLFDLYYENFLNFNDLKCGPSKSELELFTNDIIKKIKDFVVIDMSKENSEILNNVKGILMEDIKMYKLIKNTDFLYSNYFKNTSSMKFIYIINAVNEKELLTIGNMKYDLHNDSLFIYPDLWNLQYRFHSPKNDNMFIIVGNIIIN